MDTVMDGESETEGCEERKQSQEPVIPGGAMCGVNDTAAAIRDPTIVEVAWEMGFGACRVLQSWEAEGPP